VTDLQKMILATLAGFLIAYATTAFVVWDMNPANWNGFSRFMCLSFGFVAAGFSIAVVFGTGNDA